MNGCGIGAEGGKALAEALASHSDLMIVELMNNNLGEDGQTDRVGLPRCFAGETERDGANEDFQRHLSSGCIVLTNA